MNKNSKEKTQYVVAIFTLFSGILMCYLSFFLNQYNIENSVLTYFGEALIFCGAVFGINLYVKTKIEDAATEIKQDVDKRMSRIDNLFKTKEE